MPADSRYSDDRNLFQRLAGDDEQAYTEIFHLYTPRLFPFILRITRDGQLARELLQDTFLKLWEKRADLRQVEQPAAWLFRVAANICFMYLRTQANRHRLQQKAGASPDTENDVATRLDEKELNSILQKAINTLPAQRQKIYRLSREEGLTHQQIADQLGLSLQTVKNQIGIALKSIQEFLKAERGLLLVMPLLLHGL